MPQVPTTQSQSHPQVTAALADCRRAFWSVALISGVVNMLMLAGPLYMLQVYDRVLTSRSVPTLVALSLLLVGVYIFQGALDLIRSRIVVRVGALLDKHLSAAVYAAVTRLSIMSRQASDAAQPVRDLDQVRSFMTSGGPIAIVDMPWMPVFMFICYLVHPWLGYVALAGGLGLLGLTLLTERSSGKPSQVLSNESGTRQSMIEANRRNGESVAAMGMAGTLADRWAQANGRYVDALGRSSDVMGAYGSISKIVRLLLQSMMLGVGAYLVIYNQLSPGGMIAASIMMGRALAPIEIAIANWRGFISARHGVKRLSETLARLQPERARTALPPPAHGLTVDNLTVVAPGSLTAIVQGVQFELIAGEALGVLGPSGAGKTTLVRALLGIWQPTRGSVRIDGATLDQWSSEVLGGHVGFVSQAVDLFEGTVAENIARMAVQPDEGAVIAAARAAGAHEMIVQLPQGYDTKIGESGAVLSGGQRQRIALARALYGDPFLIVLDEPNSNLDNDGDEALRAAIINAKARGAIVIIVAHRPSALQPCDKMLFLMNGSQQAFGPREELMQKLQAAAGSRATSQAPNLKVVHDNKAGSER